jgi:hypothetical protein
LIIGGLFLCIAPFLWVKVSDPSAGPLLSVCYDGLLIIFQFCSVVWLWMLLTGSGDELCGPLPALFQAVAYYLLAVGTSAFPAFVYWKFHRDQFLAPPPFSGALSTTLSLCCVLVFSSLFSVQFFFSFFVGRAVSLPRVLCWFIPGVAGGISHGALCSPVLYAECLPSRFGAGVWQWWEPSCFISVMWYGEAFHRLGVQGVEVLIPLAALF